MTAQLPTPGTVWLQLSTRRLMRVIYSDHCGIVAHDAELADKLEEIHSFHGMPHLFEADFIPADPDQYPKTAQL